MTWETCLPCDNFVHYFLLLRCGHSQIDTGGFYAFMPHQIGQQSYVVVFFNEIFGKPVPKRVRMHNCQRNAIYFCITLQSLGNTLTRNLLTSPVQKYESRCLVLALKPDSSLFSQFFRYVYPPYFASFGV